MSKKTEIQEYISKHPKWKNYLKVFHSLLQETELKETIKWGLPVYTLDNKNVVGFAAFKNHTGLWFFQGVFLDDPDERLINAQKGKTKAMRQLRYTVGDPIKPDLIRFFVRQAIDNQKAGKEIKKAQKRKSLLLPIELLQSFKSDPGLKKHFEQLTPGRQKEYADYIIEAKRPSTKERRISKIIPMIEKGIGLNDKYK